MRIDILYFEGCPNHRPTTELVRGVVQSLGLEAAIREVEVSDADEAVRLRFIGSPTVHVNGQDIDPAVRSRAEYSLSCRVYGGSGSPPRALVEEALAGRSSARGDQEKGGSG